MKHAPRPQSGFAAIAAIFLVVLLAALGAFMLTFSNTQQLTSAQDLQGSRAYWAARAGLEWAVGSVNPQPSATALCPASPQALPLGAGTFEGGFNVVVTCSLLAYDEAGESRKIFQFTSVASLPGAVPGSIGYVERSLSASMEK